MINTRPLRVPMIAAALLILAGCPSGSVTPPADPGNTNSAPSGGAGGDTTPDPPAADGEPCTSQVRAVAANVSGVGGETGTMDYREAPDGCREFVLRIEGFDPGVYDVSLLSGQFHVGQITAGQDGSGLLVQDTRTASMGADFPSLIPGDVGSVGTNASGSFAAACVAEGQICRVETIAAPPDGPGDASRVTLSLTIKSLTGTARGMSVWTIVDDQPFTRADAPYDDVNRATRRSQTGDDDPSLVDISVEIGMTVTLIAIEDSGFTAGVSAFTDLSNLTSPLRGYFVGWEGDDGVSGGEGVTSLVMDGDKSVAAVFDEMPLITWGKINETDGTLSGGCFDIEVQAAPLLGRPGDRDISGSSTATQCGISGDVVLFGQLKPGSVVTVTATEIPGNGQMFDRWQGGGCGGSPVCRIEVTEQDAAATAIWRNQ